SKMSDEPVAREREPIERVRARLEALVRANAAPRCGARSKRTGKPCRGAAMPKKGLERSVAAGRCSGLTRPEHGGRNPSDRRERCDVLSVASRIWRAEDRAGQPTGGRIRRKQIYPAAPGRPHWTVSQGQNMVDASETLYRWDEDEGEWIANSVIEGVSI